MADGIMAAAGHISSIDAENQDLKTMLMDISSRLSYPEKRKRSTIFGPERRFRRRSSESVDPCPWTSKSILMALCYCSSLATNNWVDFLLHYGLLVDIRHECLVDSLKKLQTQGTVQQ
ncbi:hypothetical protein NPIL_276831 [Nephila pilipes]|uniref:Uncharacterized protein n=1 Tax=Nephila pilipes TaxID=299642 RepID=A0A8X6U2E4_NEPPI|nr:hypothetical protein NPIL_276831 [Nephila pilipes]